METPQGSATGARAACGLGTFMRICADLCIGVRWGRMLFFVRTKPIMSLESTNRHTTTLEFPPAAAGAGLVAAGLADGPRDGGFGVRLRGRFGARAALECERSIEAHGGGGLGIGQDGLDCAERLGGERPGLLAPSEVLVAAGFGGGIAKSGGTQPIGDGVAVDADELSGGGGGWNRRTAGRERVAGPGSVGW